MKTRFLILLLSLAVISFSSCEDDDDDNVQPTTNNTGGSGGGGNGSGAGTGGGTGSGGIPPNSMKATVNGSVVTFGLITGISNGGMISIVGNESASSIYPQLTITLSDTLSTGRYSYPIAIEPSITYTTSATTTYITTNGESRLSTNDTSQNLVNGRFNIVVRNVLNPSDSISITAGEFNKFYN